MDLRKLNDVTIDLKKSISFNNSVTLSCFRTEKRKGKRINENGEWKQVPDNIEFKIDKILGFKPMTYYDLFFKSDISSEYQDKIDKCCIMGYFDEGTIKEYFILNSFEEMKVFQLHIENICLIANKVANSYEEKIKKEIEEEINEYIEKNI